MKHTGPHFNRGKGYSLVEIIFGMFIFSIIFGLCTLLLISSWRRFQVTNAIHDVQRNAILGIDRFARDFSETTSSEVTIDSEAFPKWICFYSARDQKGDYRIKDGLPDWQYRVIYYLFVEEENPETGITYKLARKQKDITQSVDSSDMDNVTGAQIVASGVSEFRVTKQEAGSYDIYSAVLKTVKFYGSKPCTFEIEKDFTLYDLP